MKLLHHVPLPASVQACCVSGRRVGTSCGWRPGERWLCCVPIVSCRPSGSCCCCCCSSIATLSRHYKASENPLMQSPDVWRLQTIKESQQSAVVKGEVGSEWSDGTLINKNNNTRWGEVTAAPNILYAPNYGDFMNLFFLRDNLCVPTTWTAELQGNLLQVSRWHEM